MTPRPITEDDLHAYVDDALDTERHAEVSEYLRLNADVAQRFSSYRRQRDELRAAFGPVIREPIPAALNLEHIIESRRRPRWVPLQAAAAALLIGLGGVGGWFSHAQLHSAPAGIEALAEEAVDSYEVHTPDRVRPVELRASDRITLVNWASERLGRRVIVPDLSGSGYRFMGGRLVATAHGPAVLFMYDDDRGTRLVMLSRPMAIERDTPMKLHSHGVLAGYAWVTRGIGYSLVGPVAADRIHPLANEMRRQIERSV
ncbi:anti-sigma factor family protein [Lysobacter sp. P5_B9]